jgi:Fur family transcriptional regulator, iron response regulator
MMYSTSEIVSMLRTHGISPTSQRVMIAEEIFSRGTHMSADDLYQAVNRNGRFVSKATIYNTLGVLAKRGVIRAVIADPTKVFYDPNTTPHHHFFDVISGELRDIHSQDVRVVGLPPLPDGTSLEGVDVIVRVKGMPAERGG